MYTTYPLMVTEAYSHCGLCKRLACYDKRVLDFPYTFPII